MTVNELLMGVRGCGCGRDHICPIDFVKIGRGAITELCETTEKYGKILLVADENTHGAAGAAVESVIGKKVVRRVIFGSEVVIPDEAALERIEKEIGDEVEVIVGIGSGVINDLCKYTSHKAGLRYQIVATAPSMDGYASVGSALILSGMKVTLNAAVPEAIIADTEVLLGAPMDMIIAGYGDILGKYSCLCDWKLAALVRGEYFCERVYLATMDEVVRTRAMAKKLLSRDGEAIEALIGALVAVGILMAYVGNSRPASGSEHHFSHYFEITGILRGEPYLAHGLDVLYSSLETAKIREELLNISEFRDTPPTFDEKTHENEVRRIYGDIADEVLSLQAKVGLYSERGERYETYKKRWSEICGLLREAPSYKETESMIEEVGLSRERFAEIYGEEKIADAYRYAKDLKDRYTVLWMYSDIFG